MALFVLSYEDITRRNVGMEQVLAFVVVNLDETNVHAVYEMGRSKDKKNI